MNMLYIMGTGTTIEIIIIIYDSNSKVLFPTVYRNSCKRAMKTLLRQTSTKNQTSRFFISETNIYSIFFCYDKLSPYLHIIEN